jgi:hypothetical protein
MVTTDLVIEFMNTLSTPKDGPTEKLVFDEYEDKEQEATVDERGAVHMDLDPTVEDVNSEDSNSESSSSIAKIAMASAPKHT